MRKKRLNENYQHIRERFGHVNVQPLHITTVIRHNKVALVFGVGNLVRGFRQPQKIMMQTKQKLQNYNLTNFLFNATTYILNLSHQQQWFLSYCSFFNEKSEHAKKKHAHTKEFASERLKTAIVHDLRLHRNVSVTSYSCNTYSPVVKIVFSHSIHTVCIHLLYYFALEKKNVRILRSFSIICFDSIKIE